MPAKCCSTVEDDTRALHFCKSVRVFNWFYRTPGSAGSGVGLGLAIVQRSSVYRGRIELGNTVGGTGLVRAGHTCRRLQPGLRAERL